MPTTGDTAIVSDRGAAFAAFQASNYWGSPFDAWGDAINNLTGGGGSPNGCKSGYGFSGCGCNYMIAAADTNDNAVANRDENWSDVPRDTWDALGANFYYWRKVCNYDISSYPANLP